MKLSLFILFIPALLIISCKNVTGPFINENPVKIDSIWVQKQQYTDKLFHKTFVFMPLKDQIGIKFIKSASLIKMMELASFYSLQLEEDALESYHYGVFKLSNEDSLSIIGPKIILDSLIAGALPIYIDQESYIRYLDPEYFTVQFVDSITEEKAENIITNWGSIIAIDQWTPGYYTLYLPQGMTVFDAVRKFMQCDEVKFSEPAFYGFDSFPKN